METIRWTGYREWLAIVGKRRKSVIDIVSILYIILFVYAALNKLLDYEKFRIDIGKSPLLLPYADMLAWAVPALEMMIALMLAWQKTRLVALYSSFALMTLFTAYIIAILKFSAHIPCSCGGVLQDMSWAQHLVFNIAFTMLALMAIMLYQKDKKIIPG